MARKRMLDPKIWDSEQVMRLDPLGFKLYVYLISQADDEGRLAVCYQMMVSRVFPFGGAGETEIETLVKEMDKNGLIILYSIADKEYIAHPNWTRYQKIDRPSKSTIPSPNGRRTVGERSSNARRALVPNRIGEKGIEGKGSVTAVAVMSEKEKVFFHSIEVGFLAHNGGKFTNYALEGKAIHELIAKARARDADHHQDLLVSVCAQFWKLKQGTEKFWTEKPFLPHILANKLWDMVLETMRREELDPAVKAIIEGGIK